MKQFFDKTYQEPFNNGRTWEHVHSDWCQNKTFGRTFDQFSQKDKILIKQCIELQALRFNEAS